MFDFVKKLKLRRMWDKRYKSFQSEEDVPWHGDRREELQEIISKYKLKPGKAIDLGCGYGDKTRYLSKIGFDVLGIDLSKEAVNEATKRTGDEHTIRFLVMDVNDLDRIKEKFDLVLDLCTSHFLNDRDKWRFVSNLAGIIKTGGLYVFQTYIRDKGESSTVNIATTLEQINDLYSKYFTTLENKRIVSKYNDGAFLEMLVMRRK